MSDTTRTEDARLMLSTFLGLIPFGLVAAATMITFSFASFSFLYTSERTSRDSGYGDRGFEVEPARSGAFPYIHPNRPPVPSRFLERQTYQARPLRQRSAFPQTVRQPTIFDCPTVLIRCRLAPARQTSRRTSR
jgi:hypothetical protein